MSSPPTAPRRFRHEVVWGMAAQGLNVAVWLILLPVTLRYLPNEQLGLWFVFLTLASLVQLLELGFLPTLTRNVAYLYAGAQQLVASGHVPSAEQSGLNPQLLAQLYFAARRIYRIIAVLATFAFLLPSSLYLLTLRPAALDSSTLLWAWSTFSLGYILNFYYGYLNGFLQGRGDLIAANQAQVANRSGMLLLGTLFLLQGWGLPGLGLASLLSSLIGRVLAHHFFWQRPETAALRHASAPAHNPLLGVLWHNASKQGWAGLGGFLINRANLLIASSVLGLSVAASYGLSLQILATASALAGVLLNLQLPRISADHIHGQAAVATRRFGTALLAGWLIYGLSALLLLGIGSDLLRWIGSQSTLLPAPELALLSAILLLELNHSLFAGYLTSLNQIPFVKAALLSGLAILFGSLFASGSLHMGVLGMLLAQGLVQLAYNNWKWPHAALQHMQCNLSDLLRTSLRSLRADHA